jgi:hypothetical protein
LPKPKLKLIPNSMFVDAIREICRESNPYITEQYARKLENLKDWKEHMYLMQVTDRDRYGDKKRGRISAASKK